MFMVNRLFIIVIVFLIGCNQSSKHDASINKGYPENTILLSGFENYKIYRISFEELLEKKNEKKYNSPNFDTISNDNSTDLYFQLDKFSAELISKGCYIIINDNLKYKITDVKSGEIERYGNWGSVGYDYVLKEYKLDDSLISKTHGKIILFRH